MKRALGVAAVLIAIVLLIFWWTTVRVPRSAGPTTEQAGSATVPAAGELGACDHQPVPPALPATLPSAPTDLAGIITALDEGLNDQHKAWLRCFTLDDELLARTQNGMGRWLRTTLRLWQRPTLLTTLGATTPDEASSLIILIYVSHLRGQELSPTEARARRRDAMSVSGVTP